MPSAAGPACLTAQLATATSLLTEDLWVVDSTPVECDRSLGDRKRL